MCVRKSGYKWNFLHIIKSIFNCSNCSRKWTYRDSSPRVPWASSTPRVNLSKCIKLRVKLPISYIKCEHYSRKTLSCVMFRDYLTKLRLLLTLEWQDREKIKKTTLSVDQKENTPRETFKLCLLREACGNPFSGAKVDLAHRPLYVPY